MTNERKQLKCGDIELVKRIDDYEYNIGGYWLSVQSWPTGWEWQAGNNSSDRCFDTPQKAADDLADFLRSLCGELVAGGFRKPVVGEFREER